MTNPSEETTPNLPHLPLHVLVDILSRLPLKSLLQYKCVCKPWCSLISSPRFANAHLKRMLQDNSFSPHKLLIWGDPFQSIDPEACFDENDTTQLSFPIRQPWTDAEFNINTTQISFPVRMSQSDAELVGSCNGLVCAILDSKLFVVLNPSTREARELPPPDSSPQGNIFRGFGCGSEHDGYKIVMGTYDKVEIFTSKTNTWRTTVQGLPSGVNLRSSGVYSNGFLHWLVKQENGTEPNYAIVPFDLAEEKFLKVVSLPPQIDPQNLNVDSLKALGNCLSVCSVYYATNFEVWVLKQYGAWDSWTKMSSFVFEPLPGFKYWLQLLWVTEKGKVLFDMDGWQLVLSDPNEEVTVKQFWISTDWDWCYSIMYMETLVSPHANDPLV